MKLRSAVVSPVLSREGGHSFIECNENTHLTFWNMANRCHLKSFLFCWCCSLGKKFRSGSSPTLGTRIRKAVWVYYWIIRTFSLMCFVHSHDQFTSLSEIIQWMGNHSSKLLPTAKTVKITKIFSTWFRYSGNKQYQTWISVEKVN